MFELRIFGDPILRKTGKPVTAFDAELQVFIDQMIVTMNENDGVGLAAPQVGRSIKLAVIDATAGEHEPLVLVESGNLRSLRGAR